jgi:uncharacterized membrane protein YedE/YeeE
MMSLGLAALAGLVFGAGLLVSGMTHPQKIIGFLDITGGWDPSLMFVMASGVAVYMIAFRAIARARHEPWFDVQFHLPTRRDFDAPLLVGSAIFGIGWGLAGLCPGPGIVSAAAGSVSGIAFVAAMLAGMHVHHRRAR